MMRIFSILLLLVVAQSGFGQAFDAFTRTTTATNTDLLLIQTNSAGLPGTKFTRAIELEDLLDVMQTFANWPSASTLTATNVPDTNATLLGVFLSKNGTVLKFRPIKSGTNAVVFIDTDGAISINGQPGGGGGGGGASTNENQFGDAGAILTLKKQARLTNSIHVGGITVTNGALALASVDPPSNEITITPGTAGNPNGDYVYLYTFVTAYGETTPSPLPAVATTLTSQRGELSNIQIGPDTVIARKLYRSDGGGSDPFRYLATISDNTTTIYSDNAADASLGIAVRDNNSTGPLFTYGTDTLLRLSTNTAGSDNLFIGRFSGTNVIYGQGMTFIGTGAGQAATNGGATVAIGYQALNAQKVMDANVAIGNGALRFETNGYDHVAIGQDALGLVLIGYQDVAIGRDAAYRSTNASRGIFIGERAGEDHYSGNQIIYIGTFAGGPNVTRDSIAIGHGARVTGNNQLVIGGSGPLIPITVNSSTRSRSANVATITTSVEHLLGIGDTITVSGMTDASYNAARVTVTAVGAKTFSYANTGGNEATTSDTAGTVSLHNTAYILDMYVGSGVTNRTPSNVTIHATSGMGTDDNGASMTIAGGQGTGSGKSGLIKLQSALGGGTGTTPNTLLNSLVISNDSTAHVLSNLYANGLLIGRTNTASQGGIVTAGVASKVWKTDASGNPDWRDDATGAGGGGVLQVQTNGIVVGEQATNNWVSSVSIDFLATNVSGSQKVAIQPQVIAPGSSAAITFNEGGRIAATNRLAYDRTNDTITLSVASTTSPGFSTFDAVGGSAKSWTHPRGFTTTNGSLRLQSDTHGWIINSSGHWVPNDGDSLLDIGLFTSRVRSNWVGAVDTANLTIRAGTPAIGNTLRATSTAGAAAWGQLDLADADAITGILPAANLPTVLQNLNGTGAITNLFTPSLSNASIVPLVVGVGNAAGATNTTGQIRGLEAGANITFTVNSSNVSIAATGGGGTPGGAEANFQVKMGSSFVGSTNSFYDVTNGWLTVTNLGLRGAWTNFARTPQFIGTNVIFDGSLGNAFDFNVATGPSTNFVFTNVSVGQGIVIDTFVTNGSTVRLWHNLTELPNAQYRGGTAITINSNCQSTIIFKRTSLGSNVVDVFTKDYELAASGGLVLHTNYITGLITVSNSSSSTYLTNDAVRALGYLTLTNQLTYGVEDLNGGTADTNLDFTSGSIIKNMTNAITGDRRYWLTNAAGGQTMVVHIRGETATATDRTITFSNAANVNSTTILWRSPTNGTYDFTAHSNQTYTVFFTVLTNFSNGTRTNILAQWNTDSPRPILGAALMASAGAGTSNMFLLGNLYTDLTKRTNWNASTLTNMSSLTVPANTLTNVNDSLDFYAYGKAASTVGTNKWLQLHYGSSTNLVDTGWYPMSNGTWKIVGTITRSGNSEQNFNMTFQFPHGTLTNFSGVIAENNGVANLLKLQIGLANIGGFTNEYFGVRYVPGYR